MTRFLTSLCYLLTAKGRARSALLHAKFFAIGLIGPGALLSNGERSLIKILREPDATSFLLELLSKGSPAGQLYALAGLLELRYPKITELLATHRNRTEMVRIRLACFGSFQPIGEIVTTIERGDYFGLLRAHAKHFANRR